MQTAQTAKGILTYRLPNCECTQSLTKNKRRMISHSKYYFLIRNFNLSSKVYHHKSKPAPHYPQGRVAAREHERHKLVAIQAKDELVDQGAVQDQRNANRDIQQRKSVQQEYPRPFRHGCHSVKGKQEQDQPEDGIYRLDGKFGGCEEQREKRDMARDRQGSEGAKIPSILQRNQTEWDDDQQNRLLVNVPAEEERRISTQCHRSHKRIPVWSEPQLYQRKLKPVSHQPCFS